MTGKQHDALFVSGKAKWLLDHARELTPDQRALLLAVADFEKSQGRKLTAADRKAIDRLIDLQEGYDPDEIERAVRHMVEAKTKRQVVEWPSGLWQKIRKKKAA